MITGFGFSEFARSALKSKPMPVTFSFFRASSSFLKWEANEGGRPLEDFKYIFERHGEALCHLLESAAEQSDFLKFQISVLKQTLKALLLQPRFDAPEAGAWGEAAGRGGAHAMRTRQGKAMRHGLLDADVQPMDE